MDIRERAFQILSAAEEQLRKVMSEAANKGDYSAVMQLTAWAQKLSELGETYETPTSGKAMKVAIIDNHTQRTSGKSKKRVAKRGRSSNLYPKFYKRGENLIKVGWSKRLKKEYQHSSPNRYLLLLGRKLGDIPGSNKLITMDDVFPIIDSSDESEVPGYQVYLCFAFLKKLELIRPHGRQGYSLETPAADLLGRIKAAWLKLEDI